MKLKGIKKLNKAINGYLKRFDCIADVGTDFECDINANTISYALVESTLSDTCFKQFWGSHTDKIPYHSFISSLFHEIGHIETCDDFDIEDWEQDEKVKEKLAEGLADNGDDLAYRISAQYQYFNLPTEIAATLWGIHYIEEHTSEVVEFWNTIQPLLMEVYEKNGLLED